MTTALFRISTDHSFTVARFWTLLFSLFSIVLIHDLGRRWIGSSSGLWAAAAMAFLPASIYFGRAVIPDTPMNTLALMALTAADRWITTRRMTLGIVALGALALTALARPQGALVSLPVIGLIWSVRHGIGRGMLLALIATVLFAAFVPVGIYYRISPIDPLHSLSALSMATNSILQQLPADMATSAHWRVFANRLELTLTTGGLLLAVAGTIGMAGRCPAPAIWFALQLAFVFMTTGANVYWTAGLLPPACLGIGAALAALQSALAPDHGAPVTSKARMANRRGLALALPIALLTLSVLLSPSLPRILRSWYKLDERLLAAGELLRDRTHPGWRLATWSPMPFDLLWASGRAGWSLRMNEEPPADETFDAWAVWAPRADDKRVFGLASRFPCVGSNDQVIVFASQAETLLPPQPLIPLTPSLTYEGGLTLAGAQMIVDRPDSPSRVSVWLAWDASTLAGDPSKWLAGAQWRRLGDERSLPVRLPALAGAYNLVGESFSRGQLLAAALPLPAGGDENRFVTHWSFAIPPHLIPGSWRLEVSAGAGHYGASQAARIVGAAPASGSRWAGLGVFDMPSTVSASTPLRPAAEAWFPDSADGRCDRAQVSRQGLRIGAPGCWLSAGDAATTRVAWMALAGACPPREAAWLQFSTVTGESSRQLLVTSAPGRWQERMTAMGAKESIEIVKWREGLLVSAQLPPGAVALHLQSKALFEGTPADWPLYPDEAATGRSSLRIETVQIMPGR